MYRTERRFVLFEWEFQCATLSEKWPIREAAGSCPNKRLTERPSLGNSVGPVLTAKRNIRPSRYLLFGANLVESPAARRSRRDRDPTYLQLSFVVPLKLNSSYELTRAPTFPFPRGLARILASPYSCHERIKVFRREKKNRKKDNLKFPRLFVTLHRGLMQFCHFVRIVR